jgi:ribosomal protein S18 acetylase RimI-like enzyme
LGPAHERGTFRCGVPAFDKYLRAQAGRDAARNMAAIFVAVLPGGKVAGYYVLSSAIVLLPDLLAGNPRLVSRYPELRAARLTRLAVDKRHRGKGYAAALLCDAKARLRNSPEKPLALIADVQSEPARQFLEKSGFQSFTDQSHRAFHILA